MQSEIDFQPWHRHIWVWFIIALLATSVLLSLALIAIAVDNQDSLVIDNYYETGKGINRSLEREKLALSLQMRAEMKVDDLTGEVNVRLFGNSRPEQLTLSLISPTLPDKDRHVDLARSSSDHDLYIGLLTDAVTGYRFVELLGQEGDQQWRLFEKETIVPATAIQLGDEPLQGAEAKRP